MATLRNKTTSSGVIVRWVPHPDHTRPSTYQVRSETVVFLSELGYGVPSPGDEVEIPWDVCRPLRILGDLYFKSETPGDVETGGVGEVSETYGQSLSERQRGLLRTYIESHEKYQDSSASLRAEMEKLPEQDPEDEPESDSCWDGDFCIGPVTRFSGSGNAIFDTGSGEELNLGPLGRSASGDQVPVLKLGHGWGICLHPKYWSDRYLNFFRERGLLAEGEGPLFATSEPHQFFTELVRGETSPAPLPEGLSEETAAVVEVTPVTDSLGVANFRNHLTWIVTPCTIDCRRVSVEVTGGTKYGLRAVTRPYRRLGDTYEVGDSLTVRILERSDRNTWGIVGSAIVRIPGTVRLDRDQIAVGVSEVCDDHLLATVADLPAGDRPSVGERVFMQDEELIEYEDVPVRAHAHGQPLDVREAYTTEIVEVGTTAVEYSIEPIAVDREITPGTVVSTELESIVGREMIGNIDGLPVLVNSEAGLWLGPAKVEVTEVTPTRIRATLIEREGTESAEVSWNGHMLAGFQELRSQEFRRAVDSFTLAGEVPTDADDPRSLEAALNREIARAELARSEGDVRRALQIVENSANEYRDTDVCSDIAHRFETEIAGYTALLEAIAVHSTDQESMSPSERKKAGASVKRNLRTAAEHCRESTSISGDECRSRVHPVLVRGLHEITAKLDGFHELISEVLEEVPEEWVPMLTPPKREDGPTQRTRQRVIPFDITRVPSEELRDRWRTAHTAADSIEGSLNFRSGTTEYNHTQEIVEYVHTRADGSCEACGEPAPFETPEGTPYLELHHVDEFERTGPDRPERVIAVCPTCHTRVHYSGDGEETNVALAEKLEAGLGELGNSDI